MSALRELALKGSRCALHCLEIHHCGSHRYTSGLFQRDICGVNLLCELESCIWQVHAALIVVLTRGGSTARLVAKYRPSIPVLTVAVPVLTTDSLTWTCSGEGPARQCLVTRSLIPLLAEGSARATDTDTTDEILAVSTFLLKVAAKDRTEHLGKLSPDAGN